MIIVRQTDIEMMDSPNGNSSGAIATPTKGATEVSVIQQHEMAGGKNPPHRHNREEIMVMLAGSVSVTVDDQEEILSAGDTLIVPANTLHHLANTGDQTAEWLIISTADRTFVTPDGQVVAPPWAS